MTPSRARGLLLAGLTSLLWGTVPVAVKIALPGFSPARLSFVRLLAGGALLGAVVRGFRRDARPPLAAAALGGLGLAANYALFAWGVALEGAGTSQILIQLASLFLVVLSVALLGERPSPRQYAGAALAVGGAVLVKCGAASGGERGPWGVVVLMVAGLSWACYAVVHKRLGRTHRSGGSMTWILLAAGLFSAPAAALAPRQVPDAVEIGAAAFLVINTVIAYWAFAEALRHVDASEAAVVTTLGPVFTVIALALAQGVGWGRIGSEPLTWNKLLGAGGVVAGVMLVVTSRRKPGRVPPVPS